MRRELDSDGADMAMDGEVESAVPEDRRIDSRAALATRCGHPVTMPAAHGACLRSGGACVPDTCSARPTTRRHGSVTQLRQIDPAAQTGS